jgi:Glycosyl transferase family 2
VTSSKSLSIVIATTQPWPEARAVLDSLHDQAAEEDAEIVLAHRGDGFPDPAGASYPRVRPLVAPGASANELRGVALDEARGEVVAVTEDHCLVAPDWVEAILRAHSEYPRAAAIGGAVENGATARAIDWAAYFLGNAYAMAPLRGGDRLAAQANVSHKRWALPERIPRGGFFELDHAADLSARGEELRADPRMVVWHDQSLGFRGTLAINFHAARTAAGLRAAEMGPARRLAQAFVTPVRHSGAVALHLSQVWRKRRLRRRLLAVSPCIALVAGCAIAGTFAGFVAGPGDSARHIR